MMIIAFVQVNQTETFEWQLERKGRRARENGFLSCLAKKTGVETHINDNDQTNLECS